MGTNVLCRTEILKLLRSLYRELRSASLPTTTPSPSSSTTLVYQTQTWKFIVQLSRKDTNISQALENYNLGINYLNYLQSSHHHSNLVQSYKGKGERSTEETASMAGFRLPNEPRLPRTNKSS